MRILHLRFQNLNSLAGQWAIDLTDPAFVADGIFAITGPTGAGKSTILDAICLALYGRTPRLPKITVSGNEIMSRQTGECFAEVTFETQAGQFRCHWSQHRARRKPDGALQPPKHEIANASTGEIFESSIRGVAEQIETATGMDFDRFTRSMLLAQGGFAAFLQAAPDERAPILEQITGTEIYSQISMRVHERKASEREKLRLIEAKTAGIVLLSPEQQEELAQELVAKEKEGAELSAKLAATGQAISWLNSIENLRKEITSLADETSTLQADVDAFKPERERLAKALNAASLDSTYATLTARRKEQTEDKKTLDFEEKNLPELETSAKKQAEMLAVAEQQTCQAKKELEAAAQTLRDVRALDQNIAGQKKTISEDDEIYRKDAAKIETDKKALLAEQEKRAKAQETLERIGGYFKEHAQDEWLVSGLAGIEERLNDLAFRHGEILQKKASHENAAIVAKKAEKILEDRQKQTATLKQTLQDASKNLEQGKEALEHILEGRLLREYRTEKDSLLREMAYLAKIAELEEHRKKLEDGTPCPLCGATAHPFAEGNVPVPDATEQKIAALTKRINKAEAQEAAIKKLEAAENLARNNLTQAEKIEAMAANDKNSAEKTLTETKDNLEKLQATFAERKQAAAIKLQPLGIAEIPADISSLVATLNARLASWQTKTQEKTKIEKEIADIESETKRLTAIIKTQDTALAEKQERLKALKKELAAENEKRRALYGEKLPDEEERRMNKAISDAESAEKKARERHSELQQKWNTARTQVEILKKRIHEREPELAELEKGFLAALTPAGFGQEEQFLAARLSAADRAKLEARAKNLDERQTELKARQKDRETRLAAEAAKKVTDKPLEELEQQHKKDEDTLKALQEAASAIRHKVRENNAAKERMKEKQAGIEAQQKECRRWDNLHELIGSADGKKYRNFAQGLTFEMLVSHANNQLARMTDRYLLVRDKGQPLELNVIDSYQAGETRSTKNLSGGESFIVSLALALGLSHMASQKVRVDSLFLDEGFGTLDDEALETALETLASLRQDGKLIGVISHVTALQERISTQIHVTPRTGGRSRISGPGCSQVDETRSS